MAVVIYLLCTVTSIACSGLLLRAWLASRARLLFWSALCFAGLSVNNLLLVLDKLLLPTVDLSTLRLATGLVALLLLLFGLIWEEE
ncbi:DUF5985 family protein [Caenimonas terrae]|uniref:DUF5985 family protein n=1 Tax=Caenimonas terrae TaxID=696074 RepID=A0ABW0NF77_9BURK